MSGQKTCQVNDGLSTGRLESNPRTYERLEIVPARIGLFERIMSGALELSSGPDDESISRSFFERHVLRLFDAFPTFASSESGSNIEADAIVLFNPIPPNDPTFFNESPGIAQMTNFWVGGPILMSLNGPFIILIERWSRRLTFFACFASEIHPIFLSMLSLPPPGISCNVVREDSSHVTGYVKFKEIITRCREEAWLKDRTKPFVLMSPLLKDPVWNHEVLLRAILCDDEQRSGVLNTTYGGGNVHTLAEMKVLDASPGLQRLWLEKDSEATAFVRDAAQRVSAVFDEFVSERVSTMDFVREQLTLEQLREEIDDCLSRLCKGQEDSIPGRFQVLYRPEARSGVDDPLNPKYSAIISNQASVIISFGLRWNFFSANVGRTFLVQTSDQSMLDNYQFLESVRDEFLNLVKPGVLIESLVTQTNAFVEEKRPDLVQQFRGRGLGFGIGLCYPERELILEAENELVLKAGMVINATLELYMLDALIPENEPASDEEDEAKKHWSEKKVPRVYSLYIADTILVEKTGSILLTDIDTTVDMMIIRRQDSGKNVSSADDKKVRKFVPKKLKRVPIRHMLRMIQGMKRNSIATMISSATEVRKVLSGPNPPVLEILESESLPILCNLLLDAVRLEKEGNAFHELIFELLWILTNVVSGDGDGVDSLIDCGIVTDILSLLGSSHASIRAQAAWAIGNIVGDSINSRDYVLEEGLLRMLLPLVRSSFHDPFGREFFTISTWVLHNAVRTPPLNDSVVSEGLGEVFLELIYHDDSKMLSDVLWTLAHIAGESQPFREEIIEVGALDRIAELLSVKDFAVVGPCIHLVGNMAAGSEEVTQACLDTSNLFSRLYHLLVEVDRPGALKELCWVMSNFTAGTEEQLGTVLESGAIPILVGYVRREEYMVCVEASWAICNALNGGSNDQVRVVVASDAVGALIEFFNSVSGQTVRRDLLEAVVESYGKIISVFGGDEANAIPFRFLIPDMKKFIVAHLRDPGVSRVFLRPAVQSFFDKYASDDDGDPGTPSDWDSITPAPPKCSDRDRRRKAKKKELC